MTEPLQLAQLACTDSIQSLNEVKSALIVVESMQTCYSVVVIALWC